MKTFEVNDRHGWGEFFDLRLRNAAPRFVPSSPFHANTVHIRPWKNDNFTHHLLLSSRQKMEEHETLNVQSKSLHVMVSFKRYHTKEALPD